MSWGTCYSGSNNIHFNFPPMMDDGRQYTSYNSSVALDNIIKEKSNVKTNSDYRKYLQNNADNIIKNNQINACNQCSSCPYINNNKEILKTSNNPYIFSNILTNDQPFGYENSDLKNIYLSRNKLQAQLFTPQIQIN